MFLQRLGKQKQKYKLRMIFHTLELPMAMSTSKIDAAKKMKKQYRLKFIRGTHQVIVNSIRTKKNLVRFEKKQYTIPMTLFYDTGSKQYDEKQAVIKIYQIDELQKQKKIATTTLNMSDYILKGAAMLEIEVDLLNKLSSVTKIEKTQDDKNQNAVYLTMQIHLDKRDEDSKSVNTYSEDNQQQMAFNRKQMKSKNKTAQESSKNKQIKQKQTDKKPITRKNYFQKKQEVYLSTDQTSNIYGTNSSDKRQKSHQDTPERQTKNFDFAKLNKQIPKIADQNSNTQKDKVCQNANQDIIKQDNPTELEYFLLKKQLKEKDRQISSLKNQNESYKKIIQKLSDRNYREQNMGVTDNMGQVSRYQQQINNYKKWMVQKQLRINALEDIVKQHDRREGQYEKMINKQNKQLGQMREKVERSKYSMADLMQRAFQSQNLDLINIVQSVLVDNNQNVISTKK